MIFSLAGEGINSNITFCEKKNLLIITHNAIIAHLDMKEGGRKSLCSE